MILKRSRKELGDLGENYAAEHLKNLGHCILARNFRFRRLGELDIITAKEGELHFFEVKTRSSDRYGTPAEAVNTDKQMKIKKLAAVFCTQQNYRNINMRFHIAEVLANNETMKINFLFDAF